MNLSRVMATLTAAVLCVLLTTSMLLVPSSREDSPPSALVGGMSLAAPGTPPVAHIEFGLAPGATSASQYLLDASLSHDSEDSLEDLQFQWDVNGDGIWDCQWTYSPTFEYDFGIHGTFESTLTVKDTDDMTNMTKAWITVAEVDPPTTTAVVTATEGQYGWLRSEATVNLSAEDSSGVENEYYRVDGSAWTEYSGEFQISSDGEHELEFYSVDTESNHEPAQEMSVKVDTTPPSASFVTDDLDQPSDTVLVEWDCSDALSGVAMVKLSLDDWPVHWGVPGIYDSPGELATSYMLANLDEGAHTVELFVEDYAGNNVSVTYTFTVLPGADVDTWWLWVAVSAALAVTAVATVAWSLRKRKTPPSA
ncbi:MAG: hypothetical protein QG582_1373 [Candidatus Thermoplasmatota archaeon]|nr:hypothetical protein [Candidatus Thermoplasmatota archaeon]